MEIVNGIMTAILIVLFIGIWIWAWSSHNKDKFDRMSSLPLEREILNKPETKNE